MSATPAAPTIAVVGLGRMGQAMARRVRARGLPLVVANRTAPVAESFALATGVRAVPVAKVLGEATICVTSVADSAALEELVGGPEGLLAGEVPADRVVIDASTVSVGASRRVDGLLAAHGIGYLRAPVAGNPAVVDAGALTFLVSGDPELLAEVRPVLEAIGPTILHVGDGDQARAMKLALNALLAGTTELIVEALAIAETNGISGETALEVLTASVAGSPFLQYKGRALVDRDFTPTATTTLLAKDLRLARGLACESELSLPLLDLLSELLEETIALGHGEKDFIALALRLASAHSRSRTVTAR